MKTIYELELHQSIYIDDNKSVCMRVPGGWIYYSAVKYGVTAVFVPLNDEFKYTNKPN